MQTERKGTSPPSLPQIPEDIFLAKAERRPDLKRLFFILLGLALFALVYASPPGADAVDPAGRHFPLSPQGQAALALFLLAAVWWIFEVVPIGVTAVAVGVVQAVFRIRPARTAFTDFLDPAVWFIIGSFLIGKVLTKTGLIQRLAYRMLGLLGERTRMVYLGAFSMVAALTLVMSHTTAAATVFPLFMAVYSLYGGGARRTRFGKGLFVGMAFAAGAGSVATMLGGARAPVAVAFYQNIVHREVSFPELSYYMLPLAGAMVLMVWLLISLWFPPEKKTIPGLRQRAQALYAKLGPLSRREILALLIVLAALLALGLRPFLLALQPLDQSAIILLAILLLFLAKILALEDLEEIPWNIVFLFGGSISLGLCLFQTGAANWLAVKALPLFLPLPWLFFVLGLGAFCLLLTNFLINVAALALLLPVALALAPYLGLAPEPVLFTALAAAGMPFLLLIGAAPNAIAYGSDQFRPSEFFRAGLPLSLILMAVLALFVRWLWPLMGLPLLLLK
jgi:sodium-dependent dicarboxylate transporter 2/3/5